MNEYQQDVSIDTQALDVEWLRQASLSMKYGSKAAEASAEMDMAKQRLDLAKAELDNEIRDDPERFGILVKLTEPLITAAILKQPSYQEAYQEWIDSKYEYDISKAAVQAVEHKKSALEYLVRLYGQQYFAGPTIPRNLDIEWEKAQRNKIANNKVKITRKS